jgi:membrane fusion protein, multidrug efflux system
MTPKSLGLAPLLGALLALTACDEAKDSPAQPPRPVLTALVTADSTDGMVVAGTIEPRYRAELGFRVMGRIIARDVEVGDFVRKGQRVAAIDPTALELAVRSQRAAFANAQASRANAGSIEERQKTLRDRSLSPQATFEAAQQARIAADAEVTRTSSGLDKAVEQLSYTQLHSDFDGVVIAINAEVGQVVSVGQSAVTVARPDIREAVIDIPAAAANDVTPGTLFDVALQIDERVRTTGRLREVAPEADSATRARRARIALDNPPDTFRLGTTVTVRASERGSAAKTVQVPPSAVLERGDQAILFVVDETLGTVAEVPVKIMARKEGAVVVNGEIKAGARVVTAGVRSLNPGEPVRFDVGSTR